MTTRTIEPYYDAERRLNLSKLYGFEVPPGDWCRGHLDVGELVPATRTFNEDRDGYVRLCDFRKHSGLEVAA